MLVSFVKDISNCRRLGPVRIFLPSLPKVPTASKGKHAGLNHWATVGFAWGLQPAMMFGRGPQVLLHATSYPSVALNGIPLWIVPIPASCHPCTNLLPLKGKLTMALILAFCLTSASHRPRSTSRL